MNGRSWIFVVLRGCAFYTLDVTLGGNDVVGYRFFRIGYAGCGILAPGYCIFESLLMSGHVSAVLADPRSGFRGTLARPGIKAFKDRSLMTQP
ncbi:hypothetical protein [Mycolicibacterium sp. S2-37]|uniref:hypothetical protein n=1 Tax=Mycolicibacterium sp. S2-37 TaxID=2810297 RepID=UPI001F5EA44E|nr:hypothetical protein [Mycolicibacterium sp. S2-37]